MELINKKCMRANTGEPPFKCDDSSAAFSQTIILKNMRTHAGDRLY